MTKQEQDPISTHFRELAKKSWEVRKAKILEAAKKAKKEEKASKAEKN